MFDTRLIAAEVLKLRRRRGMVALCAGFLLLAVTAYSIANLVGHPVGGDRRFRDVVPILALLGSVIGVIVGATCGAADLETGVFRDLVATGRGRLALYGARVPGAWAVVVPLLLVPIAFEAVWCVALAGDAAAPSAGTIAAGVTSVLVSGMFAAAVSVGLAALVGSRGPVMGIVLAFQLGVSPLLAQLHALGDLRFGIPQAAVSRLADPATLPGLTIPIAVAVLLAWAAALLGAGARRTVTQEI